MSGKEGARLLPNGGPLVGLGQYEPPQGWRFRQISCAHTRERRSGSAQKPDGSRGRFARESGTRICPGFELPRVRAPAQHTVEAGRRRRGWRWRYFGAAVARAASGGGKRSIDPSVQSHAIGRYAQEVLALLWLWVRAPSTSREPHQEPVRRRIIEDVKARWCGW